MRNIALFFIILMLLSSCSITMEKPNLEMPKRNLAEELDSPEKTELLRERVQQFWTAFVKGDYEKIYFLHDPFFQAKTNKFSFMGTLGRIKYHTFEIKDINLQGNVAKVTMMVVYSLPPMKLRTKEFSQPETSTEFEETWLFIYDNWYKEFYMKSAEMGVVEY